MTLSVYFPRGMEAIGSTKGAMLIKNSVLETGWDILFFWGIIFLFFSLYSPLTKIDAAY
jgi:valyl-tRNA synthetase